MAEDEELVSSVHGTGRAARQRWDQRSEGKTEGRGEEAQELLWEQDARGRGFGLCVSVTAETRTDRQEKEVSWRPPKATPAFQWLALPWERQ